MRIGIDIDGVLTNLYQYILDNFSKYIDEKNIEYEINKSGETISSMFNVQEEVEKDFWNNNLISYATNISIRPFASEVIQKLKDDGNEIFIVTARWTANRNDSVGENMRNLVKVWLKDSGVIYDKLVFSQGKNESKIAEINEHKIDIMIEDNPNNVNELSRVLPVICYDAPYNKNCSNKNIIRAYSWYDIYKKISNFNK